jgi:drug/metabolite transporter (DMT)-like permease
MSIILGFVLMILFTVAANLLLKIGAGRSSPQMLFGLLSWTSVLGLAFFAFAGLVYAWLLKFLPLNIAQSFAAGQFIAVILAASLVLSEAISTAQWVGIFLIAAGIAIVGWSQ